MSGASDQLVLLPFRRDGLWGYQALDGEVVVSPRFGWAGRFREGLARVNVGGYSLDGQDLVDGRWGFIDARGDFVLEPAYDQAFDMCEGLACVNIEAQKGYAPYESRYYLTGGRWGFVSAEGWRIPATFDYAGSFSEGLAPVKKGERFGFVDATGQTVVAATFRSAYSFSEGLAVVAMGGSSREDHYGYADRTGKVVIEARWGLANPFAEGLGQVLDRTRYRYCYLDHDGAVVLEAPESTGIALPFSEGLALVSHAKIGTFPDGSHYPTAGPFGFIARSGSLAIPARFDYALSFQDGLAAAKLGGRWGVIDRRGDFVVEPQYDDAGVVVAGMAQVTSGDDVFYVDLRKYLDSPGL